MPLRVFGVLPLSAMGSCDVVVLPVLHGQAKLQRTTAACLQAAWKEIPEMAEMAECGIPGALDGMGVVLCG